MAGEDILVMSRKEARRLYVIRKVIEGEIKQVEAADMLSLSTRQIRRIVEKIQEAGDGGVIHKARGRESNRRKPEKLKEKIICLYRRKYEGFGPTLATEKFQEVQGITISDETLRRWLIESGDWKKSRKRIKHRRWRERRAHRGEMVQMDGSQHDWFEGRGEKCVLMGYIDDATGEAFARFYDFEGTMPAMDSFMRYVKQYGIPFSVYLDRHTTYKSPGKEPLEGEEKPLSQFERAMEELSVEVIHAYSPQAKGRIERLFGTFQDRVVKEMRLKEIKSIEEANMFLESYLPIYNSRFAVKPRESADLHREVPKGRDIYGILCVKTEKRLNNDFTIAHDKKFYQIEDKIKAVTIIVEQRLDGTMRFTHNGLLLTYKELPARPVKQMKPRIPKKTTYHKAPVDHPWRRMKNRVCKRNNWRWSSNWT
ncbi:MAG TPA: ISNCY family transposase [Thermodesulfovibrionales bacterium]|nr:ISNCY family transposase [Thermodesulfovibrionales bacterium]